MRGSTIYASILQAIVTTQGKVYIEIELNISYPYASRTRGLNLIQKAVFVLKPIWRGFFCHPSTKCSTLKKSF